VRVYVQGSTLRVEPWERPKPAEQRLTRIERLLSLYRRPSLPPCELQVTPAGGVYPVAVCGREG
jgi:hypothetical protein